MVVASSQSLTLGKIGDSCGGWFHHNRRSWFPYNPWYVGNCRYSGGRCFITILGIAENCRPR